MAVSRKGHRPVLHRGHCNTRVKYFFTVLGASQGGLVRSRLYMTCQKLLRKTVVALPCDIANRQVKLQFSPMTAKKKAKMQCKCSAWGSCSGRWEFLYSGNSGPTCCAYSKRETRYGAGGSSPGNTALLIESKASMKRPHSIILPTLLKSVPVAWRNKRTAMKQKRYMERRRKHCTQRGRRVGKKRGQKGNGNRKWMGIKSSWGSFLTVCHWLQKV